MAACLVIVLASAPSVDAVVCHDDTAVVGLNQAAVVSANPVVAATTGPHSGDVGDFCPHGHAHHFGVYVAKTAMQPVLAAVSGDGFSLSKPRLPPSLTLATPERPPRA